MVADIYGARESEEMKRAVSANDLVCAIRALMSKSEPGGSIGELPHVLSELRKPDDVVLLLGAGDIDKSMESILARM